MCFVQLVEVVTNVDTSLFKKKHRWKSRKRLINIAMACLIDLKVLKGGVLGAKSSEETVIRLEL